MITLMHFIIFHHHHHHRWLFYLFILKLYLVIVLNGLFFSLLYLFEYDMYIFFTLFSKLDFAVSLSVFNIWLSFSWGLLKFSWSYLLVYYIEYILSYYSLRYLYILRLRILLFIFPSSFSSSSSFLLLFTTTTDDDYLSYPINKKRDERALE